MLSILSTYTHASIENRSDTYTRKRASTPSTCMRLPPYKTRYLNGFRKEKMNLHATVKTSRKQPILFNYYSNDNHIAEFVTYDTWWKLTTRSIASIGVSNVATSRARVKEGTRPRSPCWPRWGSCWCPPRSWNTPCPCRTRRPVSPATAASWRTAGRTRFPAGGRRL